MGNDLGHSEDADEPDVRDVLAAWAEEHHGLLTVEKLREAQLPRRRLLTLAERDFERLGPRVLRRRGAPVTPYQEALAAEIDAGRGTALAGRSGAWLWQLSGFEFVRPVQLAGARTRAKPHRPTLGVVRDRRSLPPEHVTTVAGISVLTLPVLLYDLAALEPTRFERLADTVVGRSPSVLRVMHDLLPELGCRGRNGIALVRRYLDERPPGARVPTGLERRFETIIADDGQSPLRRQIDLGGHEWIGRVDYYDADCSLIVEIQSSTYHDSFLDRAADDARVVALLSAGFRGVLLVPESVIWYERRAAAESVRLARQALASRDPQRFVGRIRALGARFVPTEREEGQAGTDAGRMSA